MTGQMLVLPARRCNATGQLIYIVTPRESGGPRERMKWVLKVLARVYLLDSGSALASLPCPE